MDDEADDEAAITDATMDRLAKYYGHWFQGVVYLAIELCLSFLSRRSSYLIGEWAADKSMQTETDKFRAQVL